MVSNEIPTLIARLSQQASLQGPYAVLYRNDLARIFELLNQYQQLLEKGDTDAKSLEERVQQLEQSAHILGKMNGELLGANQDMTAREHELRMEGAAAALDQVESSAYLWSDSTWFQANLSSANAVRQRLGLPVSTLGQSNHDFRLGQKSIRAEQNQRHIDELRARAKKLYAEAETFGCVNSDATKRLAQSLEDASNHLEVNPVSDEG